MPHQLTVIDGTRFDLFTGYNEGAAKTTGDFLVFVHDDVHFLTNALAFGRPLQMLEKPETGFIGVIGSCVLETSGTWWGGNVSREDSYGNSRGMIFDGSKNEFGIRAVVWPGPVGRFGQVLVVDGVLLMCHRRTFNQLNGFDAVNYQGFHFYDIDTTFRAHRMGLKNYAAPLPLIHGSRGKYDAAWEKNRKIFAEKYKLVLPVKLQS